MRSLLLITICCWAGSVWAQDRPRLLPLPGKPPAKTATPKLTVGPDVIIGAPLAAFYGSSIWQEGDLLAWQDGIDASIWYCRLNPATGDLMPADGRGTFVAKGAPYIGNLFLQAVLRAGQLGTYNGPEWGYSRQGLGLYFTVPDKNGIYQQARCLINGTAKPVIEVFTSGGTQHRFANLPTQNAGDTKARVGFFELPNGNGGQEPFPAYWQFDRPGEPQHRIPLDFLSYNGPRWVPGEASLLTFVYGPDETLQVAKFDTNTETLTFLTTGPEEHTDAQIVVDPNSGRKYMTAIEDQRAIAVYECVSGNWQKTRTVVPNLNVKTDVALVFAVKPLIVRGRLLFYYNLYFAGPLGQVDTPVNIFVGSGDGTINQQLTKALSVGYCINPQHYVGEPDNKVYLYYYTGAPLPGLNFFSDFRRISFTVE